MERRIQAMRTLYRKKLYRITSRVFKIIFCVLVCGFAIQQTINYFFPSQENVQKNPVLLTIPTFDLRIYCKEIAASVSPDISVEVYNRCTNLESESYFAIREMWDNFSDQIKERCVKMVRPGDGSYFLLRDCFINEKDGKSHKERNYF
ncbi:MULTISPECIES: hypothetical protein [unclassified Bartonella]|uniref:hypothetical protein n=1 Tax=unclassified Bartonella TaxID=2645622 RepID=UPI00300DF166